MVCVSTGDMEKLYGDFENKIKSLDKIATEEQEPPITKHGFAHALQCFKEGKATSMMTCLWNYWKLEMIIWKNKSLIS